MKVGLVLWAKLKLNNSTGFINRTDRPFLIVEVNKQEKYIEVAPLSKIEDKLHKILFESNDIIKKR
ncbi:hypothetical protein [Facklamia miroungae]|uniref:Uncharacterized protein n=1 Tax=Facklamia miroungae TaxID=120956 RepID=A0A1G7RYB6_9LACT|nr:hypothetical protein [Facklamia miroungae]NKZ29232.1 hypothetical protein [Facklamia miroungae]SDG15758.1 hypothetical protein SAMN05421791_103225 [Facklamia miroungae]